METADSNFKPYASPENITRILLRARKGGVRRIDVDWLAQIGIGDGMVARTLRALEYIGFITNDGTLTPLFEEYVVASEDDAQAVLQGAIRKAYDVIFRAADPATDDRAKVHTAFRTAQPSGQWGRMVTLFLGLCQAAGIPVKEPPSNRPGKDSPPREKPKGVGARRPPTRTYAPVYQEPATSPGLTSRLDPALAGIVAKIPELETSADLERWWIMFKSAFEFVKKL